MEAAEARVAAGVHVAVPAVVGVVVVEGRDRA